MINRNKYYVFFTLYIIQHVTIYIYNIIELAMAKIYMYLR